MVYWKINLYSNRLNSKRIDLLELLVVVGGWKYKEDVMSSSTLILSEISNTHQLGLVMFSIIFLFQLAGIVLLLAMISAILLTFREEGVKKKSYIKQISKSSTAVELIEAKSNRGVKIDD